MMTVLIFGVDVIAGKMRFDGDNEWNQHACDCEPVILIFHISEVLRAKGVFPPTTSIIQSHSKALHSVMDTLYKDEGCIIQGVHERMQRF